MRDVIIGCSDNYDWNTLKYWVNSIKMTNFDGDIIMIVFRCDKSTIDTLIENDVIVVVMSQDDDGNANYAPNIPVHVMRFFHIFNYLRDKDYRYVITTDVKDVIFQYNPVKYILSHNPNTPLIFSSESLKYKDEPWGFNNILEGYGKFFQEYLKDSVIYNVGILAGKLEYMVGLCLNIFLMSVNRPISIVDQASFNVIINDSIYNQDCSHCSHSTSWACNLGTTMDPSKMQQFGPKLLDYPPKVDENDLVCNYLGEPYHIVHQYDRVPGLREKIYKKFGGE